VPPCITRQFSGCDAQRVGGGNQVWFVCGEEIEYGTVSLGQKNRPSQCLRRQAGKVKETLGPHGIGQHPAERGERQGALILNRIFTGTSDCHQCTNAIMEQDADGKPPATGGSMTKRIMVVEDNDLNRKLFCDVLQAGGFDVESVADGHSAIERARAFFPNLVVMDIQLQDVSGLDLIAGMKGDAALGDVPVLAVTAYAGKGDEQRIRDVGAEGYLSKPVSIGPFMAAVRGLIEH